jgi:hypothetical protein
MKHYSGIDYDHFLDDIRDMYPFGIEEAILTELIANSLDAKTSLLDMRIDPDRRVFELTDNGSGMTAKGFEMYHNFSTSFKRKGQGIGFAGLGAKLALKISDKIVTETRSKYYRGASEWKFEGRGRKVQPVWYDLKPQSDGRDLTHQGTRVRIYLKAKSSLLLKPGEVKEIILKHYDPILSASEFFEQTGIYKRITVLVNGDVLEFERSQPVRLKQYLLRRGKTRKPFALARFEYHAEPLPEERQGIAIATYGKVIRRDWLRQYFRDMERVSGVIEVPELVECLTTNKCEFRKDGNAGRKYYRFNKIAQQEFRRWLNELNLIEQKETVVDRDVKRLQRVITRIVDDIPDLQQFYGYRSNRQGLVQDDDGGLTGNFPEKIIGNSENGSENGKDGDAAAEAVNEQTSERLRALEEGDAEKAIQALRSSRSGPRISYIDVADREDISWMEGETVLINTAHPTYRKAAAKKILEYHNLFAIALAMLREVPTSYEKLELIERFMSGWGKV